MEPFKVVHRAVEWVARVSLLSKLACRRQMKAARNDALGMDPKSIVPCTLLHPCAALVFHHHRRHGERGGVREGKRNSSDAELGGQQRGASA